MKAKEIIKIESIQNRIYTLRGVQVMLDKDLALLYEVKSIRLREQVKRNIKRFPEDFMFQLTNEEVEFMVSQNAIPSKQYLGGHLPYVFTEQGVATLSSVLTSDKAIEMNVKIMRAFVAMRKFILSNAQMFQRLDNLELKQIKTDNKIDEVLNALEHGDIQPKQGIFFDGQVFDAYKFLSKLIRSAKKSIVLIDNYIDDTVLTHFEKRKEGVAFTIITRNASKQLKLDIAKFNKQYSAITLKKFNKAHDRFLIVDENTIYHFGASLKDLGKKWFAFSKMDVGGIEILGKVKELV